MGSKIKELKDYKPKIPEEENLRKMILDNGGKPFKGTEMIIEAFRKHNLTTKKSSTKSLIK